MHFLDHSEKYHGASTEIYPHLHHTTLLGSTSSEESDGERKVCIVCMLACTGNLCMYICTCTPYFLLFLPFSYLSSFHFPLLFSLPPLSVPLLPPPALPSSCPSFPSLSQEAIDAAMSTLNSVLESERPERYVDM